MANKKFPVGTLPTFANHIEPTHPEPPMPSVVKPGFMLWDRRLSLDEIREVMSRVKAAQESDDDE